MVAGSMDVRATVGRGPYQNGALSGATARGAGVAST